MLCRYSALHSEIARQHQLLCFHPLWQPLSHLLPGLFRLPFCGDPGSAHHVLLHCEEKRGRCR